MTTSDDRNRFLCLFDELETSRELLMSGFGHLQEIDMGSTFYHLPHQLLASGFERLMKCYIAVVRKGRDGAYPNRAAMKSLGHDLESLLETICVEHYGGTHRPLVRADFEFVRTDLLLNECIGILALFGRMGRYYNLDVVAGSGEGPIDPRAEWEALECRVEDPVPYASDLESLYRDFYPRVNRCLIGRMERLVRAIAMRFTLGGHADPGGEIRRLSGSYTQFRNLRDDDFGTVDYRRSVEILRRDDERWVKRSAQEIEAAGWPTVSVNSTKFDGEWPFRRDHVTVECREGLFYVVNIGGYDFALNGAARSKFRLPSVHETGVAALGKSIRPFIAMAAGMAS